MQPDTDLPPDFPPIAQPAPAIAEPPLVGLERDHDALLRLLDNCVTAMHILDTRMANLETKARRAVEESARERSETRADIATLRTRTKLTNSNVDQMQGRLSSLEADSAEAVARHAREITAAHADAEAWRQRAEAGIGRLTAMEQRLERVETGLERRLQSTESDLSQARHQAARMEERAVLSETAAVGMEGRLSDAVAAVADQRARIACLQAKLGAATQAQRYTEGSVALASSASRPDDAVIDLLSPVDDRRVSAA